MGVYDKPISETFPLQSRARQECPLFPLLPNIVLECLTRAMTQEKETKLIQTVH
jgi:hypothetical protein